MGYKPGQPESGMMADKKAYSLFIVGLFALSAVFFPSGLCHAVTPGRYCGMGSGGVAVTGDLGSLWINPAGISGMKEDEAGFGIDPEGARPYFYGVDYTFYYGGAVRETFARGGRFATSLSLGNRLAAAGDFAFLAGYGRVFTVGRYGDFPAGITFGGANFMDEKSSQPGRRVFKPVMIMGAQKDFPDIKILGGISIKSVGDKTSVVVGAAHSFYYDDYLAVMDLDTDSRIYLGVEASGMWGKLARARAGIDTLKKSFSVGIGAYMWPVAADVYYLMPFDSSSKEEIGCSFVWRFGGYDFSQDLLEKNTEKSAYLERKIKKSKEELADLKKKLDETEKAVKKARDFVDILDSEAAELIKKKLQMMKSQQEEQESKPATAPSGGSVKTTMPAEGGRRPPEQKKISLPARHKVVRGDSMRSISAFYYGDPNQWQKIYEANRDKIERGLPRVGEELVIPAP